MNKQITNSQAQIPVLNSMQRVIDIAITPTVEAMNKINPNATNKQNPYSLKKSFTIIPPLLVPMFCRSL